MVKYLSGKIVDYVTAHDESADRDELLYGYEILLQDLLVLLSLLLLGFLLGILPQAIVAHISYHLLRNYAGGVHAKSRIACAVTTFVCIVGTSFLSLYVPFPPLGVIGILYALDVCLIARYAPADTEMLPIRNPEVRKILKIKSLITLTICFLAALLIQFNWTSFATILLVSPTLACCLMHPIAYAVFGCEKSKEEREDDEE